MIINLSKELEAKAEIVQTILLSKGIAQAPIMRVIGALDVSTSMEGEYANGSVQKANDQLLGISVKFDDNGEIDMWKFDHGQQYLGTCKPEEFGSYIADNNIRPHGGGTAYSPVIRDIVRRMFDGTFETRKTGGFLGFGAKTERVRISGSNEPCLVLMVTDGEPQSETINDVERALREAQDHPIYFQMIGVSDDPRVSFNTIKNLATKFPNVGAVIWSGFNLSDAEVYQSLISDELVTWIKTFQQNGRSAAA